MEDKGLLWDLIKCNIRGISINHSSFKAKTQRMHESNLIETLNSLEKDIHTDDNLLQEYETTKAEFERIQKQKTQGLMIRSVPSTLNSSKI